MMTQAPPAENFLSFNQAALTMFRAGDHATFTSLKPADISPEHQPDGRSSAEAAKEMIETALRCGYHSFEWTHKRLSGEEFPSNVLLTRVEAGGLVFLQGTIRDISEQRRIEGQRELALDRQKKVNALLRGLLDTRPLQDKLKQITDGIVDIFEADFCRLWVIQPGDLCDSGCMHAQATEGSHVCQCREQCLHLKASSGRYTHIDGKVHRRVPFGCYKIGIIAGSDVPKFLTNHVSIDPRIHDGNWAKELGLVSFAGYQLRTGPETATNGVLALFQAHDYPR